MVGCALCYFGVCDGGGGGGGGGRVSNGIHIFIPFLR